MWSSNVKNGEALVRDRQLHGFRPKVVFVKAIVIVLGCVVGVIAGYLTSSINLWIGANAGVVVGLLAANNLHYLAPSLRPPTRREYLSFRNYRRIYRAEVGLFYFWVVCGATGFATHWWFPLNQLGYWLLMVWMVLLVPLMATTSQFERWRCPKCGARFYHNFLARYPHKCPGCEFEIPKRDALVPVD